MAVANPYWLMNDRELEETCKAAGLKGGGSRISKVEKLMKEIPLNSVNLREVNVIGDYNTGKKVTVIRTLSAPCKTCGGK